MAAARGLLVQRDVYARVHSGTLVGVDAVAVDVEVTTRGGQLPIYRVVGLPAASVKEGSMRIKAALKHVGQDIPNLEVTVNLAPADLRKQGAAFDLPIAMGVLAADQSQRLEWPAGLMLLGELGLDGAVRSIPGGIAMALLARELGLGVVLPTPSAKEAAEVRGVEVFAVDHLSELVAFAAGEGVLATASRGRWRPARRPSADMSEVRGQDLARRALEVAVAGGHNLLLVGPPGIGKTMLARRLPSILPPLSRDEALATTAVYSALGPVDGLITERPFRAPHHSISAPALVGGGAGPRPGEISLAHNGVLFLDELAEFARPSLEALRQPLEQHEVVIGRARGTVRFPARFMLAAAANPCPCGWAGAPERSCVCSPGVISRYRARLSGPLLDRIDLQVRAKPVSLAELRSAEGGPSSLEIRERVIAARARQQRRLRRYDLATNAEMTDAAVAATCRLDADGEHTLERLQAVRGFSARALNRLLKVARTIADLASAPAIRRDDILDAASFRTLDSEPARDIRLVSKAAETRQ